MEVRIREDDRIRDVLLFAKGRIVPISKASEWPSGYHPYCGLTSGSSLADNDKLAQKSAAG